jgi:hypothetical protein
VRRLSWLNLAISWREPRALRGCVNMAQRYGVNANLLVTWRRQDGRSAASFCRWRYTVCIRAEGQQSAVDGRGSPLRVQISDPSNRRGRRRIIARTQPAGRPVPPTPRPCPRGMDGPCYQRRPDTIAPRWLDRTSILQRRQSLTNHPVAIHSRSNYQLTNHS